MKRFLIPFLFVSARGAAGARDAGERDQKAFFAPADKALLADFIRRAKPHVASLATSGSLEELSTKTKLFDLNERLKMLEELAGVNFDRVWENVANDFAFNPDAARNISADVRA